MADITIVFMEFINQFITGGHHPVKMVMKRLKDHWTLNPCFTSVRKNMFIYVKISSAMASGAMLKNQSFFFSSKLTYNYGKWSCLINHRTKWTIFLPMLVYQRRPSKENTPENMCFFFQGILRRLGP